MGHMTDGDRGRDRPQGKKIRGGGGDTGRSDAKSPHGPTTQKNWEKLSFTMSPENLLLTVLRRG